MDSGRHAGAVSAEDTAGDAVMPRRRLGAAASSRRVLKTRRLEGPAPRAGRWVRTGLMPLLAAAVLTLAACGRETAERSETAVKPSILLVTLDTTRADSIGPHARGVDTPAFDALAKSGTLYRFAYATVPETLPSHTSMMTGLYPAAHGIHENARFIPGTQRLLAEELKAAGYDTAAFVSGFPLAGRFGLQRGFTLYDDAFEGGAAERSARQTTDRALAYLSGGSSAPRFLWVHYYDPHHPYAPPEPYKSRYAADPYRGEIAAMDEQLGRLVDAFRAKSAGPTAIIVAGDHGESLGEHGEAQHGNLLYDGAMRIPFVAAGPGITPAVSDVPVSARRIYFTIRDWAGIDSAHSLRSNYREVVVAEAMKPFLNYGWQPQMMGVDGTLKVIRTSGLEAYDIAADPEEVRELGAAATLSRPLRAAVRDYPVPSAARPTTEKLTEEERKRLASLGYVGSEAQPVIREGAPRPRDMVHLFEPMEQVSTLFVNGRYLDAIPILEQILGRDPHNVMTAVRLGVSHSALGRHALADAAFARAAKIAPRSDDVRYYRALHEVRAGRWERAVTEIERAVAETPDRAAAVEALARIRERQRRVPEAVSLWERAMSLRHFGASELLHVGELAMSVGNTAVALRAFEAARAQLGREFRNNLELGVLLLESRRYADARDALDGVPRSHPGYAMALFKRAQVAVLLSEPDRAARIEAARRNADGTTAGLIARERLFR